MKLHMHEYHSFEQECCSVGVYMGKFASAVSQTVKQQIQIKCEVRMTKQTLFRDIQEHVASAANGSACKGHSSVVENERLTFFFLAVHVIIIDCWTWTAHSQFHKNTKCILWAAIHSFSVGHLQRKRWKQRHFKNTCHIYTTVGVYDMWNLILCVEVELFLHLRWKLGLKRTAHQIRFTLGISGGELRVKATVTCA